MNLINSEIVWLLIIESANDTKIPFNKYKIDIIE